MTNTITPAETDANIIHDTARRFGWTVDDTAQDVSVISRGDVILGVAYSEGQFWFARIPEGETTSAGKLIVILTARR